MRLEAGASPHPLHTAMAHADGLGHLAGAPMRGVGGLLGCRLLDDGELLFRRQRGDTRGPRLVAQQARHPFLQVTFLPTPDAWLRHSRTSHDRVGAQPICGGEHDVRPPHPLTWAVAVGNDLLKSRPIRRVEVKADVLASHVDPLATACFSTYD